MPSDLTPPSETDHDAPHRLDECACFADELAGDDAVLSAEAAAHVAQCLRCQAEIANYKRMRRVMRGLADHHGLEAPDLEHRILVALDTADGTSGTRVPAVAAATIGGVAAAAGVIAFAVRHRRVVRLAG
ncbi:MAG: hypothetical protein AAF081_06950 [Actinomycetota bacterium]